MDHLQPPFDLSITLSSPPPASLPEVIASVAVRCERLNLAYTGSPLTDPLTQQERDDLRWYLEEYWKWPYLEFAERGKQVEALLIDIGKRLYNAVFRSAEAQSLFEEWQSQSNSLHQISIVSGIPSALSLPWELLHDTRGFLVLHPGRPIPIVRRLPLLKQADAVISFELPLRVLLITARPEGADFIDPRSIARELMDEVQVQIETGAIEIEFLRPPTLSTLRARLKKTERPIHVLHFDGHGIFDAETIKQGMLAFETGSGKLERVKATDFAKVLHNSGIRLVVLNACQSAMSTTEDVFSSVATQLISSGIDAVIAMSASFLVTSASRYVEALYRELAAGTTLPISHEQARRALYNDPRRHPHRRHWDEEGVPVELQDWWIPHFYQQSLLTLQPERTQYEDKIGQPDRDGVSTSHLSKLALAKPYYGFSGRARELLQIERWLIQKKLVVIHGFGGTGKTALVCEAAEWLTRTGWYTGACFVSFESGRDAVWLLSALGSYLGAYDGNYNPNEQTNALLYLEPILKERRILVIADNLESILPLGEAPLPTKARSQLWDLLFELARMDVGILLTSRDTGFGDQRLARGGKVAYLELKGLHPEDAYDLSLRLLDKLGIDRSRAFHSQLRDLLAQLDHHPLSIQLVLPALLDLPLSEIKSNFVALLPRFGDNVETGHNRSLLASLEYSLRRITEEQRAHLRFRFYPGRKENI